MFLSADNKITHKLDMVIILILTLTKAEHFRNYYVFHIFMYLKILLRI